MKPTKRRIDIRLKKSLFKRIKEISETTEKTWTDVIETALEYGLKWYEAKIKRELATQQKQPVQSQVNNNIDEDDDEDISEEELNKALKELYAKDGMKWKKN